MPQAASTRLGLVGPSGTDGIPLGDNQIRAIITQLEAVAVAFLTPSAYADRPAAAAGNANKVHIATDTGVIGISTGSTWVDINPKDAAAGTASLRTLGTGATQAAAGNHNHAGVYDPAGTAATAAATAQAAAIAASQPLDADLTAIAALTTTAFGRGLLEVADAIALQRAAPLATVTSLPSSPVNGQECYYLADATNGVVWHLKYRSAASGSYKWEFVGGGSLYDDDGGTEASTASASFVEPDTLCRVTVPLAGDYVSQGAGRIKTTTANTLAQMASRAGASDDHIIGEFRANAAADFRGGYAGSWKHLAVAASGVLTIVLRNASADGNTITTGYRTMKVTPVRVG